VLELKYTEDGKLWDTYQEKDIPISEEYVGMDYSIRWISKVIVEGEDGNSRGPEPMDDLKKPDAKENEIL